MRFSLRFLSILLLGPLAAFMPPAEDVEAADERRAPVEGETLLVKADLAAQPELWPEGAMAVIRVEAAAPSSRAAFMPEPPRSVFERRLSAAEFAAELAASGGLALEIPRAALEPQARHRLSLHVVSAEGRALWALGSALPQGTPQNLDLGRLNFSRTG